MKGAGRDRADRRATCCRSGVVFSRLPGFCGGSRAGVSRGSANPKNTPLLPRDPVPPHPRPLSPAKPGGEGRESSVPSWRDWLAFTAVIVVGVSGPWFAWMAWTQPSFVDSLLPQTSRRTIRRAVRSRQAVLVLRPAGARRHLALEPAPFRARIRRLTERSRVAVPAHRRARRARVLLAGGVETAGLPGADLRFPWRSPSPASSERSCARTFVLAAAAILRSLSLRRR